MHANYFRPGGVHQDLPSKLIDDIVAWCDPFLGVVDDLDQLLTRNRIFKARNVDIGVISLKEAWGRSFSGPMVRGSGAVLDLRKAQPYDCYAEMDFDIPIGKNGDCYDRYLIRMEEMRQSVRIMRQCILKLRLPDGQGSVLIQDHKISPLGRGEMKRSMEALIHHFELHTEGLTSCQARFTKLWRHPRASLVYFSFLTGRTCPTGARSGLRALPTFRRWISVQGASPC